MRRLLDLMIVLCLPAVLFAQGSRYDSNVFTSAGSVPFGAQSTMFTVPNAFIKVCAYPAAGNPCTNVVNVYSDPGLTQPITQPFQADVHGRFGFWGAPGAYTYNVQSVGGTNFGNFFFTLAGTGGGSATFPSTPGLVYSLNTSTARNGTLADVVGLWTSCTGTMNLRADGTCANAPGALSLTTTGTAGLATLGSNVLNIPNYTLTTAGVTALGTLTNDTSGSAAKVGGVSVSGVPGAGQVITALGTTTASWQTPAAQVYPAAGIPLSTGSAWGTSYTTSGTGTVVPLTVSPVFTTPDIGAATGTSLALGSAGKIAWNSDTGLSRVTPSEVAIGNGTAGDFSGVAIASEYKVSGTLTPVLSSCGAATVTGSTNGFHIASITTASCTATFDATRQPAGYCTANAWTGTTNIPVVPTATSASVVLTFTGTPTDAAVVCF